MPGIIVSILGISNSRFYKKGGGSFGEIYEVRNLKTGEECAAKEEIIKIPIRKNSNLEWNAKEVGQQEGFNFILLFMEYLSNFDVYIYFMIIL